MMKAAGQGVAMRQGGGFRQGFGNFNDEHLEQGANTSAVQQKQLTQQAAQPAGHPAPLAHQPGGSPKTPAAPPPREVSTMGDELVIRPAQDIFNDLRSIFDLNALLNINPGDTPEEKQHKTELTQKFGRLTEEQQAVAKQRFQREMAIKKQEEEEKAEKKKIAEAKKQETMAPPSSPKKGAVGPAGSRKKMASQVLERDRKQAIGRVAGAN